jgi:hypothetical protein
MNLDSIMELNLHKKTVWSNWIDVTLNGMRTFFGRYFECGTEPKAQD